MLCMESSVKAHFRVTLSVPTLAVATMPLLVSIMYRNLATYGSRVTIPLKRVYKVQITTGNNDNFEYN